jgi:poly(A) polymerase
VEKYAPVDQALLSERPDEQLELLQAVGFFSDIYPEVQAMVGFGGDGQGHKDLWAHTKQVVLQSIPRLEVRWAALFHDVGKVRTFSTESGKVTFHSHEAVSARLFDRAAKRTALPSGTQKTVSFIVRHLGYLEAYQSDWTDSAVRRVHKELGEHFNSVLALARADITTKRPERRQKHHERMAELARRAESIAAEDAKVPPLPKGLGIEVIQALGLRPGPIVGKVMRELELAVLEGKLPAQALSSVYIEFLRANPAACLAPDQG